MEFRYLLSLLAIVTCIAIVGAEDEHEDIALRRWNQYKSKFNKTYSSVDEDSERMKIFFNSLSQVVDHNFRSTHTKGFRKGLNHLSDLTHEEFMGLNGLKVDMRPKLRTVNLSELSRSPYKEAPDALDWRTVPGVVSPVKDQGHCGSCWAFATTGLLEGQERMNSTGGVVSLSEQDLIDCDNKEKGCKGGNPALALLFVKDVGGLERERDYPYKSFEGKDQFECQYSRSKAFVTTSHIADVAVVSQNEAALKEVVAAYGPVAVEIDARHLQNYESGVYYDTRCSSENLNHGVLVVGYGTTDSGEDYWIVKNSWSQEWGMSGYFHLARNRNNHCGVATAAIVAILDCP